MSFMLTLPSADSTLGPHRVDQAQLLNSPPAGAVPASGCRVAMRRTRYTQASNPTATKTTAAA